MNKYISNHDKILKDMVKSKNISDLIAFKDFHKNQIIFLQHERLIHLIITISIAFILIISYIITYLHTETFLIMIDVILTILEIFYIFHYYKLENTVQKWYLLYNEICNMIHALQYMKS